MRSRPRIRGVMKWAATALMLIAIVVWARSGWRPPVRQRIGERLSLDLDRGGLTLAYRACDPAIQFRLSLASPLEIARILEDVAFEGWRWPRWTLPRAWFRREVGLTDAGVMLPMWAVWAVLMVPTGLLWYRDRRPARWAREGRCAGCGYDIAGLAAGSPCPECGS